jgi:hypothetical protein
LTSNSSRSCWSLYNRILWESLAQQSPTSVGPDLDLAFIDVTLSEFVTVVVQTFRYTMIVIWIFGYATYTPLKYGAVLGKGAQHMS